MACKYRMTNGRRCKRQVIGEGFEYCAEHWYMLVGDPDENELDGKNPDEIYV